MSKLVLLALYMDFVVAVVVLVVVVLDRKDLQVTSESPNVEANYRWIIIRSGNLYSRLEFLRNII